MSESFDPTRYLTKVSGRDYLEVKWRLVWLRTLHPDAIIRTHLEHRDGTSAVFSAAVSLPSGGVATGWGSETASDFGDYLEKAETKAVGRALGMLGFGTQFAFDLDEGSRIVDSPVPQRNAGSQHYTQGQPYDRPPAPPQAQPRQQASTVQYLSEKQAGYLTGLASERGMSPDQAVRHVLPGLNIDDIMRLTKQQASQAIQLLQAMPKDVVVRVEPEYDPEYDDLDENGEPLPF